MNVTQRRSDVEQKVYISNGIISHRIGNYIGLDKEVVWGMYTKAGLN